jgi:hypothetical protein
MDVTASAEWQVRPSAVARVVWPGAVDPLNDGDAEISAYYDSKEAKVSVRLSPTHEAQLLGSVHGTVVGRGPDGFYPAVSVQVQVVAGENAGRSATTLEDGSFTLERLLPGDDEICVSGEGYLTTTVPVHLWAGESHVNVLVTQRPPIARRERWRTSIAIGSGVLRELASVKAPIIVL